MNRDTTSKEIIIYPSGICILFTSSLNSNELVVQLTVIIILRQIALCVVRSFAVLKSISLRSFSLLVMLLLAV